MKNKKRRFGFQVYQDADGKMQVLRAELFSTIEELLASEAKTKIPPKKRKAA